MGGLFNAYRKAVDFLAREVGGRDLIEKIGMTVAQKTGSKTLGVAAGTAAAIGNVLLTAASLPVRGTVAAARAVAPVAARVLGRSAAKKAATQVATKSAVSSSLERAIAKDVAETTITRSLPEQTSFAQSFLRGTPAEVSQALKAVRPKPNTLTEAARGILEAIKRSPIKTAIGGAAAAGIGAAAYQAATAPESPSVDISNLQGLIGPSSNPNYPLPVLRRVGPDGSVQEEPIMTPVDRNTFLENFAKYYPYARQPGESVMDTLQAMGIIPSVKPPSETPSASIDIGALQPSEPEQTLPEDAINRLQESLQNAPQPEIPEGALDSSVFQITFPEVQSDLISIYEQMRKDFGLDQLLQQRLKLLNTQITVNQEIEKIEEEIANDPDIPLDLRRRRLERFLSLKKQITDKIAAELKLIAEQIKIIQDEVNNRMGIIQDELERRERERKFNVELLKLYIENGALGAMSKSELKAWSAATGVPMSVLKRLAHHIKKNPSYERYITTDANGNQVVYFFDKNNPLSPPIKRVLDKAKVTPNDVLQAQERAFRIKEMLINMGFTESEATEEARKEFIRSLPGSLNAGDLAKILSRGFESPFGEQKPVLNIDLSSVTPD